MIRYCPGVVLLIVLGPAGCASYAPRPLPQRADLPHSASSISLDTARLPFRALASHPFNPDDGLDMDEVAMLAVANNPQLRQARDGLGIARAQSFAAGLLPDPQLGLTFDHPTNGVPGNTNAFNINPSYDVNALLLRSARARAATQDQERVNLELLWQEWQVVSQARLLFARLTAQRALSEPLQDARELLRERYERSRQALAQGNATLDAASLELVALRAVERQIDDLQRTRLQNEAALKSLLGLAADAPLRLTGEARVAPIDAARLRAALEQRLDLRPDLAALQAGYRSQEEKFRGAVLAQFPALNVGLSRARDTFNLYTLGFGVNLTLPMFNRNRGNIAIEEATRQKLYDEYQDRINAASSEIAIALENLALLQGQLQRIEQGMGEIETAARRAQSAYESGNLVASDYLKLQSALLDRKAEIINLQEASVEQQIALETLLGPDLPERTDRDRSLR